MIAPKEKKFIEYIKKEINSESISDEKSAIINKYLGNDDTAKKIFEKVSASNLPSTRFARLSEEGIKNPDLIIKVGEFILKKGIHLILAKTDPQKAIQLFEWAAENCKLSDDYIAYETQAENYDDIAVGHLWRGYALLNLGKYDEAYELLTQVIPYLDRYKKASTCGEKLNMLSPRPLFRYANIS